MISKSGVHAISALQVLAEVPGDSFAGAAEIADRIGAPRNYLGKLLKSLADGGLLESQKGKGGGFRLARLPQEISLYDVMEPIEHVSRWSGCFLTRAKCSDETPCAVHQRWGEVREAYLHFLQSTTITDLGRSQVPDAGRA